MAGGELDNLSALSHQLDLIGNQRLERGSQFQKHMTEKVKHFIYILGGIKEGWEDQTSSHLVLESYHSLRFQEKMN